MSLQTDTCKFWYSISFLSIRNVVYCTLWFIVIYSLKLYSQISFRCFQIDVYHWKIHCIKFILFSTLQGLVCSSISTLRISCMWYKNYLLQQQFSFYDINFLNVACSFITSNLWIEQVRPVVLSLPNATILWFGSSCCVATFVLYFCCCYKSKCKYLCYLR